jgi:hypothetical protein
VHPKGLSRDFVGSSLTPRQIKAWVPLFRQCDSECAKRSLDLGCS